MTLYTRKLDTTNRHHQALELVLVYAALLGEVSLTIRDKEKKITKWSLLKKALVRFVNPAASDFDDDDDSKANVGDPGEGQIVEFEAKRRVTDEHAFEMLSEIVPTLGQIRSFEIDNKHDQPMACWIAVASASSSCMVELATKNAAQGAVTEDEAIKVEGETHVIPSFKI